MDMPTRTAPGASYTQRVLIAAAVAAGLFLAWQVADVFILLFGGILLAALLRAVSDPLARMTSLPERWALVLSVVGLVGLFGGTFYVIDERLTEQLAQLATQLPDAWARARDAVEQTATGQRLIEMLQQSGGNPVMPSVSRLGSFASGTLGALANTALVLFLGLFLAANPGLYKRGMLRLLPMRARGRTGDALDAAGDALRRWLVGQLLAMTCVGLLTGVGLWMLGVPLALSLGVLAGLLDFVPYIGPVVAAVPAVLVELHAEPDHRALCRTSLRAGAAGRGQPYRPARAALGGEPAAGAQHPFRHHLRRTVRLPRPLIRNAADRCHYGVGAEALRRGHPGEDWMNRPDAGGRAEPTVARGRLVDLWI